MNPGTRRNGRRIRERGQGPRKLKASGNAQALEARLPPEFIAGVETPAFILDERVVLRSLELAANLRRATGCKVLYALKPMVNSFLLELMKRHVDGFATSSPFEARLARSVLGDRSSVHITTPGFRLAEMPEIDRDCDHVAFNSVSQFHRFAPSLSRPEKVGLRINPQLPLVDDDRYNPCRDFSKLGAPLDQVLKDLRKNPAHLEGLRGLQFHTNCDSSQYEPLKRTIEHVAESLHDVIPQLAWINLGGGYLLETPEAFAPLIEAAAFLRSRHDLDIFLEPGAAFVRKAGFLVAEVIDLFRSGGKSIAVLDTSVNHFPEVFEYQFEPDVQDHDDEADYEYILAGSTCLAGDILGEYGFEEPLRIGSRIVLPDVGAYTLVKSHMFNGINLPAIYSVTSQGLLQLRRRFTYHDFLSRSGAPSDAPV